MEAQGNWYSAMVRLVTIVTEESGEVPLDVDRWLFVFKSSSDEDAEEHAYQLGLSMEDSRINGFGRPVENRFSRVEMVNRLDVELPEAGRVVWTDTVDVSEQDLKRAHPREMPPDPSSVVPGDLWDE